MNKPFNRSAERVFAAIRASNSSRSTGLSLIRELKGLHPIEIKRALVSCGANDLLTEVFQEFEVSSPFLHEILREDNPVLSFWPFTTASSQKIARMTVGFSSIALLGVPTVFGLLRRETNSEVILFERDDYFFREESKLGFFRCDLVSKLPSSFDNKFDLVIGDPPWYFDQYSTWLRTAMRIIRPGGTIIFVLFPEGIRDTAEAERNAILSFARENLTDLSVSETSVNYETPSFEQVQLIRNGIRPINWRSAGVLVGKAPHHKKRLPAEVNQTRTHEWVERRVGCGRLFIEMNPVDDAVEFLETADSESRFLSSPSRRDHGRLRANVVSSRGHGLRCKSPDRLLKLVESITTSSDIDTVSDSLVGPTRDLFRTVATELWPRFILV